MKQSSWLKWIIAGVWLAFWLYITRYSMLDDALIHLRYAAFLHDLHFITYDGVHPGYGTSSVFYVTLLAILRGVTLSPMLPKAVSCASYLLLIALLLSIESRFAGRTWPHAIWLGLCLASLSPMGIRWLTDGMETSMVLLVVVLVAITTQRQMHRESVSRTSWLIQTLLGALLVLLRVELASLALLATCAILIARLAVPRMRGRKLLVLLESAPLLLGATLALVGIRLILGSVLPDTAIAKSGGPSLGPLFGVAHAILSSILFGLSATLLAVLSALFLLGGMLKGRSSKGLLLVWLCVNVSFPLVLFLACERGIAIEGIRYILWPLFFSTLWNALEWENLRKQQSCACSDPRLVWPMLGACAAIFLCLLPFDWHYALHAMQGRAATFQAMRGAGLEQYRNRTVIAGDVGFVGYFTGASVCDISGLVNGREAARKTQAERISWCVDQHPQLLFLTETQKRSVAAYLPLDNWVPIRQFDFVNVASNDRHYLMVP
jgi:hypothetical protein